MRRNLNSSAVVQLSLVHTLSYGLPFPRALPFHVSLPMAMVDVGRLWTGEDCAPENGTAVPALRNDWGDRVDPVHVSGGSDAVAVQRKGERMPYPPPCATKGRRVSLRF